VGWSTIETFSINVSNIYKSNRNEFFELSNINFFGKKTLIRVLSDIKYEQKYKEYLSKKITIKQHFLFYFL
jgi:nicotinic acid phosphoribosyltransferase